MDHKEKNGEPQDHEMAKEIMAGLAGAAVDRFAETKGADFVDCERAKYEAKRQVEEGELAFSFRLAFLTSLSGCKVFANAKRVVVCSRYP
jgi:hypothetical protein